MVRKYILERNKGCHEIQSIWFSLESDFEHFTAFIWEFTYFTDRLVSSKRGGLARNECHHEIPRFGFTIWPKFDRSNTII